MKHSAVFIFLIFFSFSLLATNNYNSSNPNILIIIADDCTHSDLPLYGGTNVKTPYIDKLAAQE
ncbi:hypothetical protein [Maribellus comscasis]|uniref:hypothetical protein n=1 Tax=Maribellus comscasis TaxID=2681766 RepID=UPI001C2DDA3C|nr:hypothetical protein [Maribellus comscasis]